MWEELALRNPKYVAAGVVKVRELPIGKEETGNWAGAVLTAPEGKPLDRVWGEWPIPKVTPSKSDGVYEKGDYELWTWIGIDGWENHVHIRAGVKTEFTFAQGGAPSAPVQNTAVVVFRPSELDRTFVYAFKEFYVHTDDKVSVHVWANTTDYDFVHAIIWNKTRGFYSTVKSGNTIKIEGRSAQWILSGPNPANPDDSKDSDSEDPQYSFPAFGELTYSNLVAHQTDQTELGSDEGSIFNANQLPITAKSLLPNGRFFENKLTEWWVQWSIWELMKGGCNFTNSFFFPRFSILRSCYSCYHMSFIEISLLIKR